MLNDSKIEIGDIVFRTTHIGVTRWIVTFGWVVKEASAHGFLIRGWNINHKLYEMVCSRTVLTKLC